ncbi:hypothetical protein ACHHYP_07748 [Achlya hypogyna]|uniref:Sperm-tail PG-rich repeat-containing protein n=1 Tax=Achlya hypogyna TaxID=1202772 RepID=A0A1V9ZLH6_ACHHY|nr:hypothetical protein ACHHYP_07748 [Achlya hypogyna]
MAWCSRTARSTGSPSATTAATVGPGSYSATVAPTYNFKPSFAAFGSTGQKTSGITLQTPGPGAYESEPAAQVQAIVDGKSSFFKSTSERSTTRLRAMETPGPGSYKGAEVSFTAKKSKQQLRRSASSGAYPEHVTKSGKVKWVRVPTAPSIPNIAQSFGYEEGPKGQMIAQKPANTGHTGCHNDLSGPGEYDPLEAIHRLDKPRGTNFAKSRTTRENLKPPKKSAAVPGPGAYDPDPAPLSFAKPSAVFKSNLTRDKAARPFADSAPVPGPGAYKAPAGIKPARKPEHLQFFGSTSARFEQEKFAPQPTPVYAHESRPSPTSFYPKHAAPFASTQERFNHQTKEEFDVGPGSYEATTIVKELTHRTSGRAGVFGSTTKRFESSRPSTDALLEKILEHSTGPSPSKNQGAPHLTYQSKTMLALESSPEPPKKTSSFASATDRFQSSTKTAAPCPGDYEAIAF